MEFSKKYGVIKSNILMELDEKKNELEKKGRKVINLSIGTPNTPPDNYVMEKVSEAFKNPENYKYGMTESKELLNAVKYWYQTRYGVKLDDENIALVNGSQEGIAHICFPLIDEGDIVLVPNPGYQIFSFGPTIAGAELYEMPLLEKNNFLVDFDLIPEDIAKKAKVLITSYPSNPVCSKADREFYEKLVAFAKKYHITVIHDNAYSEFVFEGEKGQSFLETEGSFDVGIEFNSLSKTYNLTGLRLSFAIGNKEVIKRFKSFRSQIDYGVCNALQVAAVAALTGPQDIVEINRSNYKNRRDILYKGLNEIGWEVPLSQGTMFSWFPIPKKYTSSTEFTYDLLEKAGVLVVPGVAFGSLGEGYVRVALVQDEETLKQGIKNIAESGILE